MRHYKFRIHRPSRYDTPEFDSARSDLRAVRDLFRSCLCPKFQVGSGAVPKGTNIGKIRTLVFIATGMSAQGLCPTLRAHTPLGERALCDMPEFIALHRQDGRVCQLLDAHRLLDLLCDPLSLPLLLSTSHPKTTYLIRCDTYGILEQARVSLFEDGHRTLVQFKS